MISHPYRPFGEGAQTYHAVVDDQGAGNADVDAELHRDFDDVVAAGDKLGGKAALLGAEDIGGAQGMAEDGEIDGFVEEFDADKRAVFRQGEIIELFMRVERHVDVGVRGVGRFDVGVVYGGVDREEETRAKGVRRSHQIAEIETFADALDADGEITTHGIPLSGIVQKSMAQVGGKGYEGLMNSEEKEMKGICRHFSVCGGCRLQHFRAEEVEALKVRQLREALEREGLEDINIETPVVTEVGSRRRARFAVARDKRGITVGFNEWRSRKIVDLEECPVLVLELADFIHALRREISLWLPIGGVCDVQVTALAGGLDVVLIGGPALNLSARESLAAMAEKLGVAQLSWRKWDRSPIEPVAHRSKLAVRYGETDIPFPPASFLQATATGEKALVAFAREAVAGCGKILDLFCGLGCFGLSMAAKRAVFADVDGPAIEALASMARRIPNYEVQQRNLIGEPFHARECAAFDAVIFDPPRGGAKAQAAQLAQSGVETVVAISCDPPSFARDARILMDRGYKLKRLQPVDQFLWSEHLEVAAYFIR